METDGDITLDLEARELRASVRRRLFGDQEDEPLRIGRFQLLKRLGRGGMGVVYIAFDPDLARRVALKVVRTTGRGGKADPDRQRRLLREAQAVARLSHPNVVTVHEVGAEQDRVYIAMELIEGPTLRRWAKAATRSWRAVASVYAQAGRGLAAAHAAGLVHRDFKPDNAIVSDEGRVRVLDFGLAQAADAADVPTPNWDATESSAPQAPPLTETGTVLGTPAYMSPEQREREGVTAASDQYSFCVALHEALLGRRPTPDESDPTDDPRGGGIPRRLRLAVSRGLATEPRRRWPSMAALAAELERLASRRRPWLWSAAAVAAVASAAALAAAGAATRQACPPAADRVAQIWSSARQDAARAAFIATRAPYAADAWDGAARGIDARLEAWASASDRNCSAKQPRDVALWRSMCLESQFLEIEALVDLFVDGEARVVEHAAAAVTALDRPDQCSRDRAGATTVRPPAEPALLADVQALRVDLSAASALRGAGRYDEGVDAARSVVERARALGYGPLAAEALHLLGELEWAAGEPRAAQKSFGEAISVGEASRHDAVVARAWPQLVSLVGDELGRLDEAERLFGPAQGAVDRAGGEPRLQAQLLQARGAVRHGQGRFGEAVALHRQALALVERELGSTHLEVARALHALSRAVRGLGEHDVARWYSRRALAIVQTERGPAHPDVATHLMAIGLAAGASGDHGSALTQFERAIEILERALGTDHARLAPGLHNLASSLVALRRFEDAVPILERAMRIDEATIGADNPNRVASMYSLGMAYKALRRLDDADRVMQEGRNILERAWGPNHPDLAYVVAGQGNISAARQDWSGAIAHFSHCRKLISATIGATHPRIVHSLIGAALAHQQLDEHTTAVELLEEALAIGSGGRNDPAELAEARFALAESLSALGKDDRRALELAGEARTAYAESGSQNEEQVQRIDTWLAGR